MMRQVTLRCGPSLALATKGTRMVLPLFPDIFSEDSHTAASSGISRVHWWSQAKTRFAVDPASASRKTVDSVRVMVAS